MKTPTATLLALSLIANLALVIVVVRTNALSTFVHGSPETASAQTRANPAPAKPQTSDRAIVDAVKNGDSETLLALLKAGGIDAKKAGLMSAGIELQKLADQQLQILKSKGPYWRSHEFTHADLVKLQLQALEFNNRLQDLAPDLFVQAFAGKYDYLDPDRRAKLIALERDYNQITAETRITSSGFQIQSDTDKLKSFADERKRELDQFLTPDEIAARDLRESPTADLLRKNYGDVIDTEAEYQAAYAIMQAAGSDTDAGRAQVESLLGPERMTKLAQMNDPDYALIQTAAARLNLPADVTTASLMNIRDQASQASADIAADDTLTAAQRRAALRDLAAKSQDQIGGVLGAEGAAAFAKKSKWMSALNKGSGFSYDAKGKFQTKK